MRTHRSRVCRSDRCDCCGIISSFRLLFRSADVSLELIALKVAFCCLNSQGFIGSQKLSLCLSNQNKNEHLSTAVEWWAWLEPGLVFAPRKAAGMKNNSENPAAISNHPKMLLVPPLLQLFASVCCKFP